MSEFIIIKRKAPIFEGKKSQRCEYVYRKGKRKGIQCTTNVRDHKHKFCKRHVKMLSGTNIPATVGSRTTKDSLDFESDVNDYLKRCLVDFTNEVTSQFHHINLLEIEFPEKEDIIKALLC